MTDSKQAVLWLLPPYVIAIYFFQLTGFLVWTVIVISIFVGLSVHTPRSSTIEEPSKPKKRRRDEVPMVEYSDMVVTRIAPKKKKKWEKKISRYSKLDRKRF